MITVRLLDSMSDIESKIQDSLLPLLNKELRKKAPRIESQAKEFAGNAVINSPEILSLLDQSPGSLRALFGLTTSSNIRLLIRESIMSAVNVSVQPLDKKFTGGLTINFQPSDFINLLSLPAGHVVYERGDLHWMKWLLTLGNSIIISNYHYKAVVGQGRSNLGIMSIGGSFRIPPQFSGTQDNNFVTRALVGRRQEYAISRIIEEALTS